MSQLHVERSAPKGPVQGLLVQAEQCLAKGRLSEAQALCRSALKNPAQAPAAEHLLGVIAHQAGKLNEAIEHVQRAVALAPQVALYHANFGEMLRLAGRPQLAAEEARRALQIEPAMPMALSNLGVALYDLEDFEGAVRAHQNAVAAKPNAAEAHSNLGNAFHALKRYDEAIAAYRRAIDINPNYADGWANFGNTLQHAGEYEESAIALRRAMAYSPHHANARSGLSIVLLMRGDFAEGWSEYEWRLRSSEQKGAPFPLKPWKGESLADRHIHIQAEQGLGDTIQFVRYLPLLAKRGCKITLRVQQALVILMQQSFPDITVLGARGAPPAHDCDAALLSLPYFLKTRLETIPADMPYLRASKECLQKWQTRLGSKPGLKIGLVWAGNPIHPNNHRRSIDLKMLVPLLGQTGTSFVSLQVGPRAADLQKVQAAQEVIDDISPELEDFQDTAGAIAALDLVIAVDTSVAHLAGALGKPVWMLVPSVTDWRWLLDREDSPWYPTLRLFRQSKGEELSHVIDRVAEQLKIVVAGDTAQLTPFKTVGEYRATQARAIIAGETALAIAPPGPTAQKIDPGRALILAEQKRRNGLLADAGELSSRALAADPNNAEAAHMLGIVAHQSGKLAEAIEHIRRAITLAPDVPLFHANLGEMCRLAGRLDEAVAANRHALELKPDFASALNNLGIVYFDLGKFEEALSQYDRALALQENSAQSHSNRGNALLRLKRYPEAEAAYRRAIELQPRYANAFNNLGTVLREVRRHEEAEIVYRQALEFDPNNPETLDNLALALRDLERQEEALTFLRRALSIEPRSDKFQVHYGSVLLDLERTEEADASAKQALALNPKNYDALNLMGRVEFRHGKLETAVDYYKQALTLKPDLVDAYNNLGNVFKELGRMDKAEEVYLQALKFEPNNTGVYFNLADLKKFGPGDQHLQAMEELAAQSSGLSKTERMQLDFALGKAYSDLHDYSRSFDRLAAGNSAKRSMITYDEQGALNLFDRIETIFTPDVVAKKAGNGDPSPIPIFVIGMPRSGTTLIEQIIASHPLVHGAGELQNLNDVVRAVRGSDGNQFPYPEFVPVVAPDALRQIGAQYVSSLQRLIPESAAGCEHVTDKMPSNYYFAGLIHLALPNAKIIHVVRDPVDTCLSCYSKLFASEQNHTFDLGEIGRYYRRYQALMNHWRRVLPEGRILDVRYEEVVEDTEKEARRIIAHCALSWDDRCLAFHQTDRPVRTASATQVRQPIFKTAVGRWRKYGDRLEPLLEALGDARPI